MIGTEPTNWITFGMIRSIEIKNFRCYRHLTLKNVSRVNVIVGDNGVGKTALLESIFLPLATSTQLVLRYRQVRGFDPMFSGSPRQIEDAIWGDVFKDGGNGQPIELIISGDGAETRSLVISRGVTDGTVQFRYRDSNGKQRHLVPKAVATGFDFADTGEDMPNFFFFSANTTPSAMETATRFSGLSKGRKQAELIKLLSEEFGWLRDINIEVIAGAPALFGTQSSAPSSFPLPSISGGVNRLVSVLVAIAASEKPIILADELENGLYYRHHEAIWRGILKTLRERNGQLITTTHSKEWLEALVRAAGSDVSDISLWRVERTSDGPKVEQFTGKHLAAGIEQNIEVRG